MSSRILVVDDEAAIRNFLCDCLRSDGHEVRQAPGAQTALELLGQAEYDLVISDVRMPAMDGVALLAECRRRGIRSRFLMLSALTEVAVAVYAMRLGAADYRVKPISPPELREVVREVLKGELAGRDPSPADLAGVEEISRLIPDETARRWLPELERLDHLSEEMLEALAAALDAREKETSSHSRRVAAAALILGRAMGLDEETLSALRLGALLHDIGKIGIPDRILLKRGPLTEEERREMQAHPAIGARILRSVEFLRPAAEIVHSHHERFDGTGYPRGLQGEEIPLAARAFSIIDALDTMVNARSYQAARSPSEARAELQRVSGTQFDPEVVRRCVGMLGALWSALSANSNTAGHAV